MPARLNGESAPSAMARSKRGKSKETREFAPSLPIILTVRAGRLWGALPGMCRERRGATLRDDSGDYPNSGISRC